MNFFRSPLFRKLALQFFVAKVTRKKTRNVVAVEVLSRIFSLFNKRR